jgi:hypothetical protein
MPEILALEELTSSAGKRPEDRAAVRATIEAALRNSPPGNFERLLEKSLSALRP